MSLPRRRDWQYGIGVHSIDEQTLLEAEQLQPKLRQHLLELFRSPTYTPPLLPAVALELLALTRLPDVGVHQVVALLGHDAMLAGQVLRVARSAAYARGEPLRSLEEAVVRLGLARVSDIFLRVSLEAKVFRAPGFAEPMARLRRHSAFTAEATRLICQQTSGLEDAGYLCGLLHDVGIAACILALGGPLRGAFADSFERAWPCIQEVHGSCSEMLAKLWGLPAEVSLVVGQHDQTDDQPLLHPITAALVYADCFSTTVGCGFMTDARAELQLRAAQALNLTGPGRARLDSMLRALALSLERSA